MTNPEFQVEGRSSLARVGAVSASPRLQYTQFNLNLGQCISLTLDFESARLALKTDLHMQRVGGPWRDLKQKVYRFLKR